MALLGHSYARYNIQGRLVETGFSPDGIFSPSGNTPPTFAGALVFLNFASFVPCSQPIVYLHPRFLGKLPNAFGTLEFRTYDHKEKALKVRDAKSRNALDKLGFVNPSQLP